MNHEEAIREKRTIDAMERKYMGAEGKFGVILKVLGSPIISEEDYLLEMGQYHQNYMNDPYEEESDHILDMYPTAEMKNELKEPDGDEWHVKKTYQKYETFHYGYVFDGLSRGFHIEIKYMAANRLLTVHYQGYQVYREERGVLESYVPKSDWEDIIDKLYKLADPLAKETRQEQKKQDIKDMEKEKLSIWERIKKTWGING